MTHANDQALLQPLQLGALHLPNRIFMAPLTRRRSAQPGNVPFDLNAAYYAQRASAGLIISEATQISPYAQGYIATPGIYSGEQRDGWRLVTDAVHAKGGHIVAQLWHVGRVSHPDFRPDGSLPVAPSAIAIEGGMAHTPKGRKPIPAPRALEADELPGLVNDYKQAAQVAKDAGFDGVQLHGANTYLIDTFLRSGGNQRTDDFGGSIDNRVRFPLMVIEALIDVWGPERVGIRVSPHPVPSLHDDDPVETYGALAEALHARQVAWMEAMAPAIGGRDFAPPEVGKDMDQDAASGGWDPVFRAVRDVYKGPEHGRGVMVVNGGYDADIAARTVANGLADAVSFGRPFIANPDLVDRIGQEAEWNAWDKDTFYGEVVEDGQATRSDWTKGYTDYATLKR